MPSVSSGSHQMLNSIQTKQVNKVKPNVNRPPNGAEGVVVSPSSYNRYVDQQLHSKASRCAFVINLYNFSLLKNLSINQQTNVKKIF